MKTSIMFTCILTMAGAVQSGQPEQAGLPIAGDGKARCAIVVAEKASAPERHAAEELAKFLGDVTGAKFDVLSPEKAGAGPKIAVGPDAARTIAADLNLTGLGPDGIVIETRPPHLILTGGDKAPRGTLYAVYTFLEDVVGCRWWTASASRIPTKPSLTAPVLEARYVPVLEYREPYTIGAFDGDWSVRNKSNGNSCRLDEVRGGKIAYLGFVHTFYPLVPPKTHFEKHPEWYSLLKGKRTVERGQLCLTNKEMAAFVVEQVKTRLKDNPRAIVSVSQNDWRGNCECENCAAVEKEEGSPAGLLLRFINTVAEAVEKDYPEAAIDTLAYQYTRKPPKLTKPRANVIVRLCSIECSFSHPLTHDKNASFRDDIEGWSKICQRLYVWDYITDFTNYVQPFPNLRVLGPNVRFFVKHGVKGIFEEGNYQSPGGELAELRAWVLARLLWNPELKDEAVIDEFLDGYYEQAAPFIRQYVKLVHDRVEKTDFYLGINAPPSAPFLSADVMVKAEELFRQAAKAVADSPASAGKAELLKRVELAHLPVRYVFIVRWPELQAAAEKDKLTWPLPDGRLKAIDDFERVCREQRVTQLAEWGGAKALGWLREKYGPQTKPASQTGPAGK